MERDERIYVAGHRGLVGSALNRALEEKGYQRLITRTHQELDLTCQASVNAFFEAERPHYVFLAAAKVGGIFANNHTPADFIELNLQIQTNVITAAKNTGVKRLLFLGSSCIYPKLCPQPIKEEYLLTGPLEPTNRPYALAKIAGIELCWAMNRQHKTQFLAAMPTNLYGPGDNYDLATSHVIPALIRKMHEAKVQDEPRVVIWGTGTPKREFLHSDDLADACLHLMNLPEDEFSRLTQSEDSAPIVNIGCGEDIAISDLAKVIAKVVGFKGELVFDTSKPDGTPRKVLNVDKLNALGWQPRIFLNEGIEKTYRQYNLQKKVNEQCLTISQF